MDSTMSSACDFNKNFVYLIFINKLLWYHPKKTYENTIQKDMNKFHMRAIQILVCYKNWFASNSIWSNLFCIEFLIYLAPLQTTN